MRRLHYLALTLGLALTAAASARAETLTVYTYDSFTSEWGPGPAIETAFEAQCGCDLEWVGVDDAALLLSRLRLEGVGMWMGYEVRSRPSVEWMFVTACLGILGIGWHFLAPSSRRGQDKDTRRAGVTGLTVPGMGAHD